jgi:L-ascorbate metabolism protein UlaG (beta-lactamase superfamily)
MGAPHEPLVEVAAADAALVTHLHPDHFDPATLKAAVDGGDVFCPAKAEQAVTDAGLSARGVAVWESVEAGGFHCTAVPAVDGLGDAQVSWVVDDGETRVIHCGDTLWHGHWWRIAARLGPFSAAFLCINGAVFRFPALTPSEIAADLTPEQAAAAAAVLKANVAIPIHWSLFDSAPTYEETADAEERFRAAAAERDVHVRVVAAGETIEVN